MPQHPEAPTRLEAIDLGLVHYVSRKPCADCGGTKRYVSNSACVTCAKADAEATRKLIAERRQAARDRAAGSPA